MNVFNVGHNDEDYNQFYRLCAVHPESCMFPICRLVEYLVDAYVLT